MIASNKAGPIPDVIYIMGTARSGSTILEILLASADGVFGAGELTSIVKDGLLEDKPCSCGKSSRSCATWSKIFSLLSRSGFDDNALREWNDAQKKLDHHSGFLRQVLCLVSPEIKTKYREFNLRLLSAIGESTHAPIVLDSSKYAGRALALVTVVQANVKVICLTRSPAGIMSSFQKPNREEQRPKKPLTVFIYYLAVMASLRMATRLLGRERVLFLNYEDMLSMPEDVLRALETWCGVNLEKARLQIKSGEPFSTGHIITGNRIRKLGTVKFGMQGADELPVSLGIRALTALMDAWRLLLGL